MSEQSSLHEKIIKNYNTIVQNMKKYIENNTYVYDKTSQKLLLAVEKSVEQSVDGVNRTIIVRGELVDFDLIAFLRQLFEELNPVPGGGKTTYKYQSSEPEEPLTRRLNLERQIFESNTLEDIVDKTKKNIVIIGGSINGLYMSILLKLFMSNLNVIIVTDKKYSETLIRKQRIRLASASPITTLKPDENTFLDTVRENFKIAPNIFENFLKSTPSFSLIPDVIKECFNFFGISENDSTPINVIEYCFANYTQELGNYILFKEKEESIDKYITDETIMMFDATGGRLGEIMSYNWTNAVNRYTLEEPYHRKGYNETPIAKFKEKLCLAIGDSLYQGSTQDGKSVVISFGVCFTLSLVLSKILSPTLSVSELEEPVDLSAPASSVSSAAPASSVSSAARRRQSRARRHRKLQRKTKRRKYKTKRRKYKIKRRNRSKTRAKKY